MKKYLKIGACLVACLFLATINLALGLFAAAVVLVAYAFSVFDEPAPTYTPFDPGPPAAALDVPLPSSERYLPPLPAPLPPWHAPLTSVLERVAPFCADVLKKICSKHYDADPILTGEQTWLAGTIGGAIRAHGVMIEKAIRESLQSREDLLAWDEPNFRLSHGDTNYHKAATVQGHALAALPYGDGDAEHRTVQVDLITFEKSTGIVRAYEIKRSHQETASLINLQIVRSLLVSYARTVKQLPAMSAEAYTIAYYAGSSKVPGRLCCHDLDAHFQVPGVCDNVTKATAAFKADLQARLNKVPADDHVAQNSRDEPAPIPRDPLLADPDRRSRDVAPGQHFEEGRAAA